MGTRGFLIVRCSGRYFIYYNHLDSYPEGLGEAIVAEIPADPEEYQKWLERTRQTYTRMSRHFEEDVLTVSPEFCQPGGMSSPAERYARSYLAVDDRLEWPPTHACLHGDNDLFIEWTYTLDLDNELFGVDNGAFFKLSRMPHEPLWAEYLGEDRHGRRTLRNKTPEDLVGNAVSTVEVDSQLKDSYKSFSVEEMEFPETIGGFSSDFDFGRDARKALLARTMIAVYRNYRSLLDGHYLKWTSASFPFREFAFAILSIAAGQVAFQAPQNLNRKYVEEGFFLIPNKEHADGQQTLLPRFLYEGHAPGVEPGSAPQNTTFWLNNVLVHLTSRTDLIEVEEAAVAAVVKSGLDQGLRSFRAVVFSIMDVILIEVQKKDGENVRVMRSPLMNLVYFDEKNSRFSKGPRTRAQQNFLSEDTTGHKEQEGENEGGEEDNKGESTHTDNTGEMGCESLVSLFSFMLIRFFDTAIDQHLGGTTSRVFPNEILSTIMESSDYETYQSLAKASACFRDRYYRSFRLNDDYAVLKDQSDGFIVEDLCSGSKIHSKLNFTITDLDNSSKAANQKNLELCPVIGTADAARRSIIDEVCLTFSNVPPKHSPYRGKGDMPVQESFRYIREIDGERLFKLPEYLYPGSIEDAFGRYLLSVLQGEKSEIHRFMIINVPSYRCLRPPRYRELAMDHFFCSGLRAFIRHGNDESPEEWEETIQYAVNQLDREETSPQQSLRFSVRGRPVIIAFTRKVKLFYYVHKRDNEPPVIETSRPHCVEIAERCLEADPRRRLVDLVPGNEPLNLDDKESRETFESWIRAFSDHAELMTEWDPFTGRQISIKE